MTADELRALEQAATPGPWDKTKFDKPDGTPILTVEDVAECTTFSCRFGGAELHGLTIERTDPEGRNIVVCYTGNGPTSEANAALASTLRNSAPAFIALLEAAEEAIKDPGPDYIKGLYCGVEDRDLYDRYAVAEYAWEQALDYVASILRAAVLAVQEVTP